MASTPTSTIRPRASDLDNYVGKRMRERRVLLGLTQQELAHLIGVTYQQAHKYERGINRIAAGRLFTIAQVLGVPVNYFFDDFDADRPNQAKENPQQRLLLELARNFMGIKGRKKQEAVCALARTLAGTSVD